MSLLLFFQSATAGTTVTPDTASLTTATFAPTVTASDHKRATPNTASLSLTTFAPTVSTTAHQTVTPSPVSLTLEAFAPVVTASDHQTVTPTTAELVLTTFAPTVALSDQLVVTPSTASLILSTFAPTVTATSTVIQPSPPHGAALVIGPARERRVRPRPVLVTPGPLHLSLTTYPPAVRIDDSALALVLLGVN